MKLLLCYECNDIRKISRDPTTCTCGHVVAQYCLNGWDCWWNGKGKILGIHNQSLIRALRTEDQVGEDPPGNEFVAFTIPNKSPRMHIGTFTDGVWKEHHDKPSGTEDKVTDSP